jgi:hypothetical protein
MKTLYEVTIYSKCRTVIAAKNAEEAYDLSKELPDNDWDMEIQEVNIEEIYEDDPRDD